MHEEPLYCRIVTEGLFGLDPAGFGKFNLKPYLPKGVERMTLRNIRAKERRLKTRSFMDEKHDDDHCSMCGKQFCAVRTSRRIRELSEGL